MLAGSRFLDLPPERGLTPRPERSLLTRLPIPRVACATLSYQWPEVSKALELRGPGFVPIVDDDASFGKAIERRLKQTGYVDAARGGFALIVRGNTNQAGRSRADRVAQESWQAPQQRGHALTHQLAFVSRSFSRSHLQDRAYQET
jgi:hypothetical protein